MDERKIESIKTSIIHLATRWINQHKKSYVKHCNDLYPIKSITQFGDCIIFETGKCMNDTHMDENLRKALEIIMIKRLGPYYIDDGKDIKITDLAGYCKHVLAGGDPE